MNKETKELFMEMIGTVSLYDTEKAQRLADKFNNLDKPEGEAPQAVPLIWYDAKSVIDTGLLYGTTRALTIMGSSEKFGDYTTQLFPAVQHADSGAQAALREIETALLHARNPMGDRLTHINAALNATQAALAAQSQGAQGSTSTEVAQQWKPLTDVQWMNIVNHDRAYESYSKDDAVHEAVKRTEAKLKEINSK